MTRRSFAYHNPQALVPHELIFWCAIAVMAYSLVVPLFACESLHLAEGLLRFAFLHQCAILLLVMASSLLTFGRLITQGWSRQQMVAWFAVVLLLLAIQPAAGCCSRLVAWIAGAIPTAELPVGDLLIHLLPIAGSLLLMSTLVVGNKDAAIKEGKPRYLVE
jgi:hypothetical protein